MIAADDVIAIKRHFRLQWEEAQRAWVLLYPEGMVKLSDTAGEIFRRIDGVSNVEAIVAALGQSFPGAELRQDVLDFLEAAHGHGWITTRPHE